MPVGLNGFEFLLFQACVIGRNQAISTLRQQ